MMKNALLYLLICISTISCTSRLTETGPFVIENVRLFDGDTVFSKTSISVANGLIEAIGPSIKYPEGAIIIDGSGKTIIPGLINAHVHAGTEKELEEAARVGVMVLFDLLNTDTINAKQLRQQSQQPNLAYYYSSGPVVTAPGSHGTQFGAVPTVTEVNEVDAFIRQRRKEGSDFIKIIFERGGPENPLPSIDSGIVAATVISANRLGLTTVVHASRQADALASVRAGANGLAHIWRRDATPITDEEINTIVEKEAFVIPTLLVYQTAVETVDWPINLELQSGEVSRMHKAGVPVLVGTDPPNFDLNYGDDFFKELELLDKAGLEPLDLLRSSTALAADAFNRPEHGRIKIGRSADMILIQGDPTKNLLKETQIIQIWKQGVNIK